MLTSYSRVTIVSGSRRVDLALPSALPVADVVPQVLRFCAPEESAAGPAEFTLAKVGGQSLSLAQSLGEAGVHDGDVIELRALSAPSRAAFVEDVRDAIEDAVDEAGGAWTTRSTVTFVIGATSAVLLLLLVAPMTRTLGAVVAGSSIPTWELARCVSGLAAAAILVGSTWVAGRWANGWVEYLAGGVAALWALTAAAELMLRSDGTAEAALTVGLGAGVVVAGALRSFSRRATPLLAASVVLLVAAAIVLVAASIGAETGVVVRIVALLAVLSVGVMPRVSIAMGGLSSADYRIRNAGRMSDQALTSRLQESSGLLLGALYGISILVGAVGSWLALRPQAWGHNLWDGLLSASLAAVLLLRSRVFSRTLYLLPLRLSAVLVLFAILLQLGREDGSLDPWLAAVAAGVGGIALGLSILRLSEVTRARINRALNVVEFIVVVDLVVVTMGAVALYDWLRDR